MELSCCLSWFRLVVGGMIAKFLIDSQIFRTLSHPSVAVLDRANKRFLLDKIIYYTTSLYVLLTHPLGPVVIDLSFLYLPPRYFAPVYVSYFWLTFPVSGLSV